MFDPSLPADATKATAAEMRAQLTGLKAEIDAIPGITSAVVDSVTTTGPGEPATVSVSVIGTVLHISLALPRGADGVPGMQGEQGLQGPPFASAVIDSVGTLNPGENATVSVSFDGSTVHFSFGIPRGAQGEQGIQGESGQVTTEALNGAISSALAGTSNNTNGVAAMDTPFTNDPPTLADLELMRANYNLLVAALRRQV